MAMGTLSYLRLFGFTAGTLLQLFWIVLILGYRRPRTLERVLFLLALALFFFYSGSLLALNAQIYYPAPPPALLLFAMTLIAAGLTFLPPLLAHLHIAYLQTTEGTQGRAWSRWLAISWYLPAPYFILFAFPRLLQRPEFGLNWPAHSLGRTYGAWLVASMLLGAYFEGRFARHTTLAMERAFHRTLQMFFVIAVPFVIYAYVWAAPRLEDRSVTFGTAMMLASLAPSALLAYFVLRYNFLQIGRQHSLVYAVSVAFLALLYLSVVRRVSVWLEQLLPPEATAAILLFTLVIFFEPSQRRVSQSLHERFQVEVDRLQRLMGEIQQQARQGDLAGLLRFAVRRIQDEFGLADVRLRLGDENSSATANAETSVVPQAAWSFSPRVFSLKQANQEIGVLEVFPHGAALSGETRGALEFLAEQLPAALDLCRLIEQKIALERELAERERLALLGQMAASISHNLKNPLSSMKTILQVQLENPALPPDLRRDCDLVVGEIDRLSAKLGQLLQFSKPSLRLDAARQPASAKLVADDVMGVLRQEAERRGVLVESAADANASACAVRGSAEDLHDVLSNLLVNAIEAQPGGGRVRLQLVRQNGFLRITIEDDGPGIPAAAQKRIFEPFFTTKSHGTGLGLAIVARRVSEMGGEIHWRSPINDGKGAQFAVTLPIVADASLGEKREGDER